MLDLVTGDASSHREGHERQAGRRGGHEDRREPLLGPAQHEVGAERDALPVLEVLEVGVCGTDREIARFDHGTPPPLSDRLVIGHESLARVIATGRSATGIEAGDLVVTEGIQRVRPGQAVQATEVNLGA